MSLISLEEIIMKTRTESVPFWRVVLSDDMEDRMVSEEHSISEMRRTWNAMLAASGNYDGTLRSMSGLSGGDGARYDEYASAGDTICGKFMSEVLAEALKMTESNACMKRIVAAPTAGSSGVIPAVLVPLWRTGGYTEQQMIEALYTAGGIGSVIAQRASISGAAGGCQAEVGSAAAMAAGALVCLKGGDGDKTAHAVAMALNNLMGLICDPVAGFVEVPCIKRNVAGAFVAVSSADMALAGIKSRIPPDEVIDTMGVVGAEMPLKFRETATGGIAGTPTALEIKRTLEQHGLVSGI